MVNLRARQYEPATMRFSQRDIIRGFTVIPSTQNRYAYCLNSPLVFTDPSGEFVLAALLIGAAIGAIVGGVSSYKAQKAATGKVDGWKVAKDALIGGVVGAVAGLVGAAVASVLVPAVGATTLTTAGISTRLTFLQSAAVASVSAVSAGVAARATLGLGPTEATMLAWAELPATVECELRARLDRVGPPDKIGFRNLPLAGFSKAGLYDGHANGLDVV